MNRWFQAIRRGWASFGEASLSLWPSHRPFEEQVQDRMNDIQRRLEDQHRALGLSPPRKISLSPKSPADAVAEAWRAVGDHMYAAMDEIERTLTPEQRRQLHQRPYPRR